MKRRKAYVLIAVVAIVLAFSTFQFSRKQSDKDAGLDMTDKTLPVTIASVVQREFADAISAVGTMTARETSLLSPKVPGAVNQILVNIGDRVKCGAVVIELDRTNYALGLEQARKALASSEAALSRAEAQYELAEKEFRRATELLEERVIPQRRFDAAEAAFKSAKEAVSLCRGQRDQAEAALGTAMENFKDTEIRTPISGAVVERTVEIGQAVAPGAQLLRIVDQSYLKADIDLPEGDIGRLAIGAAALITVDSYPGKEFPGKVIAINPMVDRQTRTFQVRIQVSNQDGGLVDGMFARVRLLIGKRRALSVPRDAIQRLPGSGAYYVFVVDGDKAIKRSIDVGVIEDEFAEVTDGLAEGEKVVTSVVGRLRSGTEITVQKVPSEDRTAAGEDIR
ncbi:MAG: efflux RND transporter periplasmic adaptor subunit [Desulfobacteraceae bacterium]|nr:MAG: efflux RND transporter periplasmic adaptor subunit [Desulfobacteraceae bacterium]